MSCSVCGVRDASVGVLCGPCSEELSTGTPIARQQIELHAKSPTTAALIDPWGHTHHLDATTIIGRAFEPHQLTLLDRSVSRRHAEVKLDHGTWLIRDIGSAFGTFLEERRIIGPEPLPDRSRVRFGQIAMFFVARVAPSPIPDHFDSPTYRYPAHGTEPPPPREGMPFELHESTGGGGVIVISGKTIQLTGAQYELMALLAQRMRHDRDKPDDLRGFVSPDELRKLSLDTRVPHDDHVRQLVRRVRRALLKADVGDLIESRRNLGYRLRVTAPGAADRMLPRPRRDT